MSRSCSTIGYDFTLLNQSDSAVYYLQKGIDLDPSSSTNYYNMGINYLLLKRDTSQFLDYFEQSLEKGYPLNFIKSDPDVQGVLNDERMKKLLAKYAEE